jgi:hypothetical protein
MNNTSLCSGAKAIAALLLSSVANAQTCPPAGAAFVIKGFASNMNVTSQGGAPEKGRCKFFTEWNADLWWAMGSDVVPAGGGKKANAPAATATTSAPLAKLESGQVYRCTLPGIGLFHGAYFGIVNGSTYRNFDGKRGSYSYDASTGVLRMTSGPSKGMMYRRESEGNFRVLDEKGNRTGGNCPYAPGLKIDGRW